MACIIDTMREEQQKLADVSACVLIREYVDSTSVDAYDREQQNGNLQDFVIR